MQKLSIDRKKQIVLLILDGFAFGDLNYEHNAFAKANHNNFQKILKSFPSSSLSCSGKAVGLPQNQMGNSETGHSTIGAGRIIFQSIDRINNAINANLFNEIKNLTSFDNLNNIHLVALFSEGGIHSHADHILAICNRFKNKNIFLHIITDGRDTKIDNALEFLPNFFAKIQKINPNIKIATISGRFYTMDRDSRWERTKLGYDVIAKGTNKSTLKPIEFIKNSYNNNTYDEFIQPTSFNDYDGILENDGILFVNFRSDRMRQIVQSFVDSKFSYFQTKNFQKNQIITMTNYFDIEFSKKHNISILFDDINYKNTLGQIISEYDLSQIRIAETEKYPHVTFFFNCGQEEKFPKEDRIMIPSLKIQSYDLQPEMRAYEIKDEIIKAIDNKYNFIVANFANGDMVGHTGNFEATIKAVEHLNIIIGELYDYTIDKNITLIITADHGNIEEMKCINSKIHTQHTLQDVPFIIIDKDLKNKLNILNNGSLANIAPTILDLFNIPKPIEMNFSTLIKHDN